MDNRLEALKLSVDWYKQFVAPSQNVPAKMVVDTAREFMLFLDGDDSVYSDLSQKSKNLTARKTTA